jgi:hypothetical protein
MDERQKEVADINAGSAKSWASCRVAVSAFRFNGETQCRNYAGTLQELCRNLLQRKGSGRRGHGGRKICRGCGDDAVRYEGCRKSPMQVPYSYEEDA